MAHRLFKIPLPQLNCFVHAAEHLMPFRVQVLLSGTSVRVVEGLHRVYGLRPALLLLNLAYDTCNNISIFRT